ncbi:MAG: histidinol-phosphatase HisJ family protein [Acidobacteria bacterium]|nr:histidinol-phosphatase HisJ family protein [Acidobacteriota bacterium]
MIPHDYHIHTRFSADSSASMEEMCEVAVARGIPEIGFAEHYDLHPDENQRDWLDLDRWAGELEACRARYAGRLTIRAGIEAGEPHLFADAVRDISTRYPFDYILGSLHWVGRENVFFPGYFVRTQEAAFRMYFEELEQVTRVGEFDILAHFDIPIRAGFQYHGSYDPSNFESLIRPILRNCIERQIAIEINTGSLRRSAAVLNPGPPILHWYAEMGGKHLTLGSDSHHPQHVGAGLDVALAAAKEAGLKHLTRFEGRAGRLMSLDAEPSV